MNPYLGLLGHCLQNGVRQKNRTGIDTFFLPGEAIQFDLRVGFPILTTKEVNFKAVVAELIGFIRGANSAKDFRDLGTKIWDVNANDPRANGGKWINSPYRFGPDHLGRIYGQQWRRWLGVDSQTLRPRVVDQLGEALRLINEDPTSRRIVVSAWQPAELDQMALPPCHLLFQFLVEQQARRLHLCMYQRSCDLFLGVPFNISSYALLLSMVALVTGYEAGNLSMMLADCHIYENHVDQVKEQLTRKPKPRPKLMFSDAISMDNSWPAIQVLESIEPKDIWLEGYDPHPPIKAEMAA